MPRALGGLLGRALAAWGPDGPEPGPGLGEAEARWLASRWADLIALRVELTRGRWPADTPDEAAGVSPGWLIGDLSRFAMEDAEGMTIDGVPMEEYARRPEVQEAVRRFEAEQKAAREGPPGTTPSA